MKTIELPLVEEILGSFRDAIGDDFPGYRNHVYRVIHLCHSLGAFSREDQEKIQVAGCFHDIGIWTAGTLDYLAPSEAEAERYLRARGRENQVREVVEMIGMHHRIRSCEDSAFPLVEAFRRADIADFSLGLVPMGISRALVRDLQAAYPNAGFHRTLARLAAGWLVKHPFNPLPMFRR